jgi:hypothetical protein
MDLEKQDNVEVALLGSETSPKRYATSEFRQFWVVLKRTLLFSRRDWVGKHSYIKYGTSRYTLTARYWL